MTVNARTNPDTGLRFYDWQGNEYPSVTSIRRLIGMPFSLHNWALSQVVDRAIFDHDKITDMLARPRMKRERVRDANVLREVRAHLRAAATEERDRSGDRGDRAHKAIAAGVPLDKCDPDIVGYVAQFLDFLATTGATVLHSERQCFNLTLGYAGTLDALLLYRGRKMLTDYKTSKGVYLDHLIQLMAYTMSEFVGENDRIDTGATQDLLATEGMAVLHLSDTQWEFIEVKAEPALFQAFIGGLAFARFLHSQNNSIDGLVVNRTRGGTLIPALAKSLQVVQAMREETHNVGPTTEDHA